MSEEPTIGRGLDEGQALAASEHSEPAAVCTENSDSHVVVMQPAEERL